MTAPDTFDALWRRAVVTHADSPFLVFEREGEVSEFSYARFGHIVERVAATLLERGVGAGDAVHLCLRNCPAFVALWLAAARIGAWIVPVDPASTPRDLADQLARTGPALGICAAGRSDVYLPVAAEHGLDVIVLDETTADIDEGSHLLAASAAAPVSAPGESDRLAVMFTSGTTSQPKGVVLTQRNYAHVGRTMAAASGLAARHRWLVALPLFHANAQYYCFAPAIAVGASVALTSRFSASGWVGSARRLAATHASLFAAPIRMILARTSAAEPPVALEHVWFAQSLGAEHHRAFGELVGRAPRQLYGMTETVAIVTADDSEPPAHDLIGVPVAGRTVALVDPDTGAAVPQGRVGMLAVAGEPGVDLFERYLDDEATTSRTLIARDARLWLLTGDLAVATGSGALRFVGRADDVIKVAGENVSLTEVEAIASQAPGVLEAAVVAQDDEVRDRVPVAYVVPRDPLSPPVPRELAAWAEQHLPPQARPREWHIIAELPRTSVGKIRRFRIDQGQ